MGSLTKTATKILIVILCITMLSGIIPVSVSAYKQYSYNAGSASSYALTYWSSYNPNYSNYNSVGGDCCNFVSQCLFAGGLQMDDGWFWYSYNNRSGSWTVCSNLKNYLCNTLGCQYISNPSASQIAVGDVLYYNNGSHVGICSEIIDGIPWVCAHNNDRRTSNWKLGYSTYGVIKLNGSPTPPTPDTVSASTNKKLYCVGENAEFSFYAENASSLHLFIYLNGNSYFEGEFSPSSTYSRYLSATGHYAYYIVAHYPSGDKESSWNDFDVVQDFSEYIPAKPDVWADSYSLPINQSVTIYHWSETASSYLVSFYKDDVWQYAETHYTSSFTTSFSSAGNYSIAVQALNEYGESAWNTVGIIVYDTPPSSPTLTINREELAINDEIIFYYNAHNAENYWIGVYKDGELLCEAVSTVNSYGYTPSDPGNYSVVVTAINIFGENYAVKQFSVYNKVSYVVFFGNGGVGVPDDQAKEFGQLMTLSTETPTRDGYTFTGWNTKADGTGTSYAPGDSYTANEDVTLYAQWIANPPTITPISGAAINNDTHQITGLIADCTAAIFEQNYVTVSGGSFEYDYTTAKQVMGTGTKVKVYDIEHQLVDTYTIVIFGDIDGDGWYNGADAFLAGLIASGSLSEDALTDAQRIAADCNHDGVIDEADVELLEQAGILLANVDQTLTQEELVTNSAYMQYMSIIDQTPEAEAEEDPVPVSSGTNETETEKSIFDRIIEFLRRMIDWLFGDLKVGFVPAA